MIIDLNEAIEIEEVSELRLCGANTDLDNRVELTFSKEALIGFAINLIWLYENTNNRNRDVHFHIDPLGSASACQTLGFFLTPTSPFLVIQLNDIKYKCEKTKEWENCKKIATRFRSYEKFEIKKPSLDDLSIEEYEIGFRNIVDIKVLDKAGGIINDYVDIVLAVSYGTLKKFATMLLVLANNYSPGKEYLLANLRQEELQYNMGLIFAKGSPDVVVRCGDLGCVYDYDPNFGLV